MKIKESLIIVCVLMNPILAFAQSQETPPREETRGERMAREVEEAEMAKVIEAARKAAEEKYAREQAEQFRRSAAALGELWDKYKIESRENRIKTEAQMKVDTANYQRKNIIVGPILKFFDLFKGPQWADKLRQQEEARERARIEAERMKEEKAANKALQEADKKKVMESEKKAEEDARRREAARKAEQLKRIQENINRINKERKAAEDARKESEKDIKKGMKRLEDLKEEKKPKTLP